MDDILLQFNNFSFQYTAQSEPTLYNIDLTVRKGEKLLIVGPSGCGKSTLAHCINGLIPFSYKGESEGSVKLKGREIGELGLFEIAKSVGTVLQDSDGQFIGLTVAEDIAFALENDCTAEPALHERVMEAAKAVNMEDYLHHAPRDQSGGQKQRVSMAGVLVEQVDLLLFDEPLANLDPATGKQAIELIDELQKRTGAAVIIIEHRLEDVLHRHVDRVVLMNGGRILADTDADTLLCSSLLQENGIREPLYLTALKYAGVELQPSLHPWSMDSLQLTPRHCEQVRSWFNAVSAEREETEREAILSAENIGYTYPGGHRALSHISAELHRGEMAAIVGKNGAGKSTFAKLICGFMAPECGTLCFSGRDLSELSIKERADHIGYVMQNPNQMISKTMIFDEVALGLRTRNVPEEEIRPRVEEALKTCGLYPFRNWPISALSYGQKKRVTIAAILVLEPEIIILDEPTAGQDYRHYTEIMEFLSQLNRRGITVILITHDMHLMLEYAPRSLVFSDGQLIADKSSAAVLTDPEIIEKAYLKETSLYHLAIRCGLDPTAFVRSFIRYEREVAR